MVVAVWAAIMTVTAAMRARLAHADCQKCGLEDGKVSVGIGIEPDVHVVPP